MVLISDTAVWCQGNQEVGITPDLSSQIHCIICMHVCAPVCVCAQKPEEGIESSGSKLQPSARAANILNCGAISPAFIPVYWLQASASSPSQYGDLGVTKGEQIILPGTVSRWGGIGGLPRAASLNVLHQYSVFCYLLKQLYGDIIPVTYNAPFKGVHLVVFRVCTRCTAVATKSSICTVP